MVNQGKNILIGLFVVAALSILIFILLYLHPSVGDLAQTFHVRFDNIDKINVGTRVTMAGKAVGEVTEISEVPEAREEEAIHPGPVYLYDLTIKVDSGVRVYKSDLFSIRTSGLLGERAIEITPAPPPKGKPLVLLSSEDIVYAQSTLSVEDMLLLFKTVGLKVELSLDYVNGLLLEVNQKHIVDNISNTVQNLSSITTALNQPEAWEETVKNMLEISRHFKTSSENFSTTMTNFSKGEGTLGRLFVKDDLYLRTSALMGKANILMDDINHYGLLFHNNKMWQRVRARRVHLLQRLCSPQEFRNFFNDELDQIYTSLSRVSMVLEESEEKCMPDAIVGCGNFEKIFAELLRRVKELEENIILFDQLVMEIKEKACEAIYPQPCDSPSCPKEIEEKEHCVAPFSEDD